MEKFFYCSLYVCDNPSATFNDKMSKQEKIKLAVKSSNCNKRPGTAGLIHFGGYMDIICTKTIPVVKKNGYNYATEILTGVKIPLIGENACILNCHEYGKVNKPYYAKTELGLIENLRFFLFYMPDAISPSVTKNMLYNYMAKHTDEDGTFNTYKKQLEELIQNSIREFENIKITEYVIDENMNDIYGQIKRTRGK